MSSPRLGSLIVLLLGLAGLVGLAIAAAVDQRDLAFANGVPQTDVAAEVWAGETACQRRVRVQAPFEVVEVTARPWEGRPIPPLVLEVLDSATRRRLGRGAAVGGLTDEQPIAVAVGRLPAGGLIDVCVTDPAGVAKLALVGGKRESVPDSPLYEGDARSDSYAVSLRFLGQPRSVLTQLPTIFSRAAVFRPRWVGAWTFWVLLGLVGLGVPALTAWAVGRAARESPRT